MSRWFNKHGEPDTFALTISDAYYWHRGCPCQPPLRLYRGLYILVRGKGPEGDWAGAWLRWLSETHLEPRGLKVLGFPSKRVLEVKVTANDQASFQALPNAIIGGRVIGEPAPEPPDELWARYRL